MKRSLLRLILGFILLAAFQIDAYAGVFTVFGPKAFVRENRGTVRETASFDIKSPNTSYTLRIYNGGTNSEYAKVSSSVLKLNGSTIFDARDFNQQVSELKKQITVSNSNRLDVELRSEPGSGLTVVIEGEDNAAPEISITSPETATYTGTADIIVTGKATDSISWVNTVTVNGKTAQLSGESYSSDVQLTEGRNTITAAAADAAGNTGNAAVSVILDTIPPRITLDPIPSLTNKPDLTMTGNIEDASPITGLTINGKSIDALGQSPLQFSGNITLSEGLNKIAITATDKAGNTSSTSVTITLDTIAPIITITSPANGTTLSTGSITVTGTVDDDTATVIANGVNAMVSHNTFSISNITLAEGSNTITVTANDHAGNTRSASISVTRKTGPAIIIQSPTTGSTANSNRISVTAVIYADNIPTVSINGFPVTVIPYSQGSYNASISDVILTDGLNTITITATDPSGNTSTASVTVSYNCKISITVDSPADGSTINPSSFTVNGYVSGSISAPVAYISPNSENPFPMPLKFAGADAQGTNKWNYSIQGQNLLPYFKIGANTITVSARDVNGVIRLSTVTVYFPDLIAPVVSVSSPADRSIFTSGIITLIGKVDDSTATVTVNDNKVTVSNNAFTTNIALTEGRNIITITAMDSAGNKSPLTITVYLDTTPPTITSTNPSFNGTGISIDSDIKVTFSEAINFETATTATFSLKDTTSDPISGSVSSNGNTVTFKPLNPLKTDTIYTVTVKGGSDGVKDLAGYLMVSDYTWVFKTEPAVEVDITEPYSGATINKASAIIKGSIKSPLHEVLEIGVTVNGIVAEINGNNWIAIVPLTTGINTIEATATDSLGNTGKQTITINTESTDQPLKIATNPTSGIAPLNTSFIIDTILSNAVTNYKLDFEGDGVTDMETASKDGIVHLYDTPGLYFPTVTITDNQYHIYTETTIVNVLDKEQMDTLLKGKWDGLKTALGNGDAAAALSNFDDSVTQKYSRVFNDLGSDLPSIAASLEDITLNSFIGGIAEYAIGRNQDGQRYIYFIYFMKDNNGIWKIRGM